MHLCQFILLAAAFTAFIPSVASSQETPPEYSIREAQPRTGTSVQRKIISASRIPLNKRWDELSPEVKAEINGFYERMGSDDEPPFPAEGMRKIYDAVAKAQARLGVRGELILVARVNSIGEVTEIKAIGSPSEEMTKFVASVLFITKFKPALCRGQPCKMEYPLMFDFSVNL